MRIGLSVRESVCLCLSWQYAAWGVWVWVWVCEFYQSWLSIGVLLVLVLVFHQIHSHILNRVCRSARKKLMMYVNRLKCTQQLVSEKLSVECREKAFHIGKKAHLSLATAAMASRRMGTTVWSR